MPESDGCHERNGQRSDPMSRYLGLDLDVLGVTAEAARENSYFRRGTYGSDMAWAWKREKIEQKRYMYA